MHDSAPIAARNSRKQNAKLQEGLIISFTTIQHPPAGFGSNPRLIGLIELEDGTHVMGNMIVPEGVSIEIGMSVSPRMRLQRINDQGLRIYDVAYEITTPVREKVEEKEEFPGYILALSGPSGVGTSTINKTLTTMFSEYFKAVPIVTTRETKKYDRDESLSLSREKFEALQSRGEIIASMQAKDGEWVGYRKKDIDAIWKAKQVPVVVPELDVLDELVSHYGRRTILSCGLLPPGKSRRAMVSQLLHRLRQGEKYTEDLIKKQIEQSKHVLTEIEKRTDLFDHVLVNEDADTVTTSIQGFVIKLARI